MTPEQNQSRNNPSEAAAPLGERLPPQSLEAEMSVLGAMILNAECMGEIVETLSPEHFYRQDHRLLYEILVSLFESHKPVDLVVIRDELSQRGILKQVGDVEYLVRLVDSVSSAANAVYHAEIVRDKALLRELIRTTDKICKSAYDARGEVAEILEDAERHVFEVTQQKISGQAVPMHDVVMKAFELLQTRDGGLTGLPSGYLEMDELTNGLQRGEMIIVAARPSMGKTALGLNIAENVGANNRIPVAIFSLEMGAQQLAERVLCGRARVDSQLLRKGKLSEHQYMDLHAAANDLTQAPIFIDDSPGLTPLELRAKCRRLKSQHDIQLIVIDYLQLMHSPGSESRQQEVGVISRHLKAVARELEVPVIVMSQLNRGPEGREGHRPRMSDLRESGNIEQDADVVMLLHREDYYHTEQDYERTNTAEVILTKQRNGPTGTIELSWMPQYTRFESLSHAPEPPGF